MSRSACSESNCARCWRTQVGCPTTSSPGPSNTTTGATRRFSAACGAICTAMSPKPSAAAEDVPERRTRLLFHLPGDQSVHPLPLVVRVIRTTLGDVDPDVTAHHDVAQLVSCHRRGVLMADHAQQDAEFGVRHHVVD